LRELELAFAEELAVVGVHSGKFIAERVTSRIVDATLRLDVAHPVVNDRQYRVWRSYAVNAWPTIVAIDPRGYVLGQHAGEFTAEALAPFLENMIAASRAKNELELGARGYPQQGGTHTAGLLCYPDAVAISGKRVAISDTGHHRLLVGTLDEAHRVIHVEHVVGSGVSALQDGIPGAFDTPQGMAFDGGTLYVTDAANHAVRAVDLATGALRTVAGDGNQLRTEADVARGRLSSPWDVTVANGTLYVAMAGSHQIYAIDPETGATRVHAGTRAEALHDAPLAEAALAQPMGIANDGARLYFADAESSAIRTADIDPAGEVRTLVGTGLFDFGDRDGVGDDVRLQHPQRLARHRDGRILIADSYNDALKWLDPATRRVTTWVRGLHEPGGVACGELYAWVADTNAHRICAVSYETGELHALEIVLPRASG
jgi:DNA-binding beta-propeller fold protein YncE